MKRCFIAFALAPLFLFAWMLGPFQKADEANPILQANPESSFYCPMSKEEIAWEAAYVFNPAAVVREGKVYLIYRAEDESGSGIGKRTSRLGLAVSSDGIHFVKYGAPILYPDLDGEEGREWPGGCEDPRIVETEEGLYLMTYTQWNRKRASLAIATSPDLIHWKKEGSAFGAAFDALWSKSGSIVCRREGDRLIATKVQGKYWMYFGEGTVHAAVSDDLLSWMVLMEQGKPKPVLKPRGGLFDGMIAEPGPPALLTDKGIVLIYNGKNSVVVKNPKIPTRCYSAGQVLFDLADPSRIIDWPEDPFLIPERPYEKTGQYKKGTVFTQGLVPFMNRWFLYYGMADSTIGAAVSKNI